MIERKEYLKKLIAFRDSKIVKVVTGIRRCGKSVLLSQYKDYLLESGVSEDHVVVINFELLQFEELKEYKKLHDYVLSKIMDDQTYYLIIDEVQEVSGFEKAVDSLLARGGVDIYLTGSNSKMLSTELSTLLSGRYVEIAMLPFSFQEYFELKGGEVNEAFSEFLRYGGMPYAAALDDPELKRSYLEGIYHTVLIKDLIERKRVADVELFKDVLRYLLETIGNNVSSKKIADTATSYGRKTNHVTVGNYMDMILESYIMYKAFRYDIRGKERLKTLEKYYTVDLGFRSLILGEKQTNLGATLENVVFLELIRRGYSVFIGKIDDIEVDFIAVKGNEKEYIQVSTSILDPKTWNREIAPLKAIKDNYKKTILSLDRIPIAENGIEQVNLIDWLLGKSK